MEINTTINTENIIRAKQVLIDNGVDSDEVNEVLIAVGYTLLDVELSAMVYEECEY